jgi:hypothetical protein
LAISLAWLSVGLLAPPAFALPLIAEVFYDAVGSDNGHSFVELYGAPGTPLAGFVLEGVNGANGAVGPSVSLSGAIGVGGFFVVADDLGDGTTLVAGADGLANFDFQKGPDSFVSRDSTGVQRWRKTFIHAALRDEPDSAEAHSDPLISSP